jgi:hypothetical protein
MNIFQQVRVGGSNWEVTFVYVIIIYSYMTLTEHAAGGAVGWGTVLQAGRLWIRFPKVSL